MAEEKNRSFSDESTKGLSFEEHVKKQLDLIFNRIDLLDVSLRTEMVERFLQLSRQIQHLDKKVDVFIQEQIYLKDEWRELRESLKVKG